jgi:sec-independent protein translocase protein TatA
MLGFFDTLGPGELLVILAIVLLLFGAKRLPEMARSLGRSSREFKKGMREGTDEDEEEKKAPEARTDQAPQAPQTPAG